MQKMKKPAAGNATETADTLGGNKAAGLLSERARDVLKALDKEEEERERKRAEAEKEKVRNSSRSCCGRCCR